MRRLTVSLSSEIYESIDRLAALQGVSKSFLINQYLAPAVPAINNTTALIERLRDATDAERLTFKAAIDDFSNSVEADLKHFERHVDGLGKLSAVKTPS